MATWPQQVHQVLLNWILLVIALGCLQANPLVVGVHAVVVRLHGTLATYMCVPLVPIGRGQLYPHIEVWHSVHDLVEINEQKQTAFSVDKHFVAFVDMQLNVYSGLAFFNT